MRQIALVFSLCLATSSAGFLGTISGAVSTVYNAGYNAATRVKDGIAYYMPKLGTCPVMPAQQNRGEDIDDFLGWWYVQSALDHEVLCGQASYTSANVMFHEPSNTLTVNAQQLNENTNTWDHLTANARPANESLDEFKFLASFKLPYYGQVGGTYTLIKSDFTRFGIMHGCGSFFNLLYYDIIWLLSRGQNLGPMEKEEFDKYTRKVLAAISIDPMKFKSIIQRDTDEEDDD